MRPQAARASVVFPAPLGPVTAVTALRPNAAETSTRAGVYPAACSRAERGRRIGRVGGRRPLGRPRAGGATASRSQGPAGERRRRVDLDRAGPHRDDPVCDVEQALGAVLGDDDGDAVAVAQVDQCADQLVGGGRVELARRLVEEQHPRPHRERPRRSRPAGALRPTASASCRSARCAAPTIVQRGERARGWISPGATPRFSRPKAASAST